ncbi:NADase-type glycan-binding domain-containing protein [Bacteroides faecichinchillae]|uniref:NADase-type glycan-binding domain-containing protein n=1 Tax=Bacteroides faecichinchillae TaxID=871325 RepID=UPI003F7AF78D
MFQELKSEEFVDGKENCWDIIEIRCSFYCTCGVGELSSASSELKPQHGISYRAENAHDLSYRTAWIEGVPGYGVEEYLVYRFPPETPRITYVIIINRYIESDKAWRENSHVKKLKMYVNEQPYAILNLKDSKQEQIFSVEPIEHGTQLFLRYTLTELITIKRY